MIQIKNNVEESKSPQVKENGMPSNQTKTKNSDFKNGVGQQLEIKDDKIELQSDAHVSKKIAKSFTNVKRELWDIDEKKCKDIISQVQMLFQLR